MSILNKLRKASNNGEASIEVSPSISKPPPFVAPPPIPFEEKINALLHFSLESLGENGRWDSQTYIDGTQMKVKEFYLSTMVLGMFDMVVVAKLENGTTYYDFLSKKYAPNAHLIDFIQRCYTSFGCDKYGKGVCTQRDTEPLKRGDFSRNWDNIDILQTKRAGSYSLVIAMRITLTD